MKRGVILTVPIEMFPDVVTGKRKISLPDDAVIMEQRLTSAELLLKVWSESYPEVSEGLAYQFRPAVIVDSVAAPDWKPGREFI